MYTRRVVSGAVALVFGLSACSDSATTSSPSATVGAATTAAPASTAPSSSAAPDATAGTTAGTTASGGSDPGTTVPGTTTSAAPAAAPLGDPAECPLGALDKAIKPVDISFWYAFSGGRGDVIKSQVDAFNASQDQVVVHAEFQGGASGFELSDKYLNAIGTGNGPDVVSELGANTQTILDSKSTVPVGACIVADGADFSDLLPAAKAIGMVGDTLAAMPWGPGGQLLYYNRAAFSKAGLDPDKPPTTLDEIRVASKAIIAAGAAKHGLSIFASANNLRGFFGRSGEPWAVSTSGEGRADHSNGGGKFGLALMTELRDMVDTGELLAFANGPNPDDLLAIASGDSAMAIASAGSLGDVIAAVKSGVGQGVDPGVGVAPSFGPSVSVDLEGAGAPLWLARGGDPAKVEAGYRFVKWMMEPAQLAQWVIKTGSIAIRTSAADRPELQQYWAANPLFRVATDQVADPARPVVTGEARVGAQAVAATFNDAAAAVLTQGADPATALADATAKADAAIADYNARSTPGR